MHPLPRFSQRMLALFMILLLLSTAGLAPLRSSAAQPLCVDNTIWDAEEQACIELASPTPTEDAAEPTATESPEPTIPNDDKAIDDEGTSDDAGDKEPDLSTTSTPEDEARERSSDYPTQLGIFTMECPWNFDVLNADPTTRVTTCTDWVGSVTYDLSIDGYGYGTDVSPAGAGGAGWYDIGSGLAEITISPATNYNYPLVVACQTSSLVDPPRNATYTDSTGQSGLGGFRIELQEHDIWYCSAYFMELPTGSVTLTVHGCPDALDIYTKAPSDLATACRTLVPGIEFLMLHTPAGASSTYTSNASKAIFYRVPPGMGHIRMVPPEGVGLPVVYCERIGPQGQTLSQYDWVYLPIDASFDVEFTNDETTFCDVFIVKGGIEVEVKEGNPEWVEGMPPASPETGDEN